MKYRKPELEIIQLQVADVITSSPVTGENNGDSTGETAITTPPTWG